MRESSLEKNFDCHFTKGHFNLVSSERSGKGEGVGRYRRSITVRGEQYGTGGNAQNAGLDQTVPYWTVQWKQSFRHQISLKSGGYKKAWAG